MLPNYHFLFFFKEKSFTRTSTEWISHFSIFIGSRSLKFYKKGPIPSNVNMSKLLALAKVTMSLTLF